MATLLGSLAAHFIAPPEVLRNPEASAWEQTHAFRLWYTAALWGESSETKRLAAPSDLMGGEVFYFTRLWAQLLNERLMPQTKCWDHTREEHIRYLLPNTGRRAIPPPEGADRRPPVGVGYDLVPMQLTQTRLWLQKKHSDTITLADGHSVGQSFVTRFDYDLINAMALFAPLEAPLPAEGYSAVLYDKPDRRRVLARTTKVYLLEQEEMKIVVLSFEPPPRLRYNRGGWRYLIEVTWKRPAGYAGPAPEFYYVARDEHPVGEMSVDGAERHGSDLAFSIVATHTDVEGYELVVVPTYTHSNEEWPPYFLAVRKDVLQLVSPGKRGETLSDFFKRLNKVLLEL